MKKIVIDKDIPYIKGLFEPFFYVEYIKGDEISRKDVENSSALIVRTRTKCNEELLANSEVKLIVTATIGTDHIDMDWCQKSGIVVKSAVGCNSRAVLQWFAAVMVAMSEKYGWSPSGKSIGVVGVGKVGSLIADFAETWGFKVLRCDPPIVEAEKIAEDSGFFDFETILNSCDIITFHTPLKRSGNYPTHHMLNMDNIETLNKRALIINASRGEVVDTQALLCHVNRGGRCCLDTWEGEPYISKELLDVADIATPHIAGYSKQGKATATAISANTISEKFSLPIKGWFPDEVQRNCAQSPTITWNDLCSSISNYYNIDNDTLQLRANSENFEELRSNYNYRDEYF